MKDINVEKYHSLRDIFGPERVSYLSSEREAYARDMWPRLAIQMRRGEQLEESEFVVWPTTTGEVSRLLQLANQMSFPVVPFGGGTGVCGGAIGLDGAVVCDMKKMDRIVEVNPTSMLARVQVGLVGENLERELNRRGFTLGHFPSSIYGATVGGFAACRSAGQASTKYGKFEDMVTSLQVVLPDGIVISTKTVPRKATGPDINSLILGSEGALAIVTEVTVKIKHMPDARRFLSYTFDSIPPGLDAIREFMQEGLKPAVVRLYDETDTALSMTALGYEDVSGCLLIVICEGGEKFAEAEAEIIGGICKKAGGLDREEKPAKHWLEHRYAISYNQSPIMSSENMILDTIEVACLWRDAVPLYESMRKALEPYGTAMAHFSHAYPEGISIYFTVIANAEGDEIAAYDRIWKAAMTACLRSGGVISHHHGIGRLKAPWLKSELGEGYRLLSTLKKQLDPNNILNPGVLGIGE